MTVGSSGLPPRSHWLDKLMMNEQVHQPWPENGSEHERLSPTMCDGVCSVNLAMMSHGSLKPLSRRGNKRNILSESWRKYFVAFIHSLQLASQMLT